MLGFKDLFSKASAVINSVQLDQALHIQTKAPSTTAQAEIPGRQIVARYEKRWEQIAANGSVLASKVAVQDTRVKDIANRCEAELASWRRLQQELETLNAVSDSVDSLRTEMQDMCSQLQQLDAALDGHLTAREEKELHRWKAELERDTNKFENSREMEVRSLERSLQADLAKKTKARLQAQAAELAQAEKEAQAAARLKKKEEAAEAAAAKAESAAAEAAAAKAKSAASVPVVPEGASESKAAPEAAAEEGDGAKAEPKEAEPAASDDVPQAEGADGETKAEKADEEGGKSEEAKEE
mmetsp:Transcript_4149/g.8103  ORF Transcript_4149/g.8103 Transcript_4149/m.8103 type:complete len:298 (-) Transcript_4149:57-950(-)